MKKITMSFSKLVEKIMNCDQYVRFVAISDMDGNMIDSKTKQGISNFLPSHEMHSSIKRAVESWKSRKEVDKYLGQGQYVLAVYDNVKRITLRLDDEHVMLVALDNRGGQKDIVERIMAILGGDYTIPITPGPQC